MKVSSATAVLIVDRVEPTRDFFKRAGFEVVAEVPDGDTLGFVILMKDGVQVMAETRANSREPESLRKIMKESRRAAVFVEVDDVDAVVKSLEGAKVLVERHTTFYGSDELSFEEPGGNLVTFARITR
jgi:hypothetical protein